MNMIKLDERIILFHLTALFSTWLGIQNFQKLKKSGEDHCSKLTFLFK